MTWEELEERLARGQDERTLFLPQDISPEDLARYAAGLANHKGGTLFLGVSPEGKVLGAQDLHPLQVTHALFELTQGLLLPYVEVVEGPWGRVLALHVPQSPAAIAVGTGRVPFWDGRRLSELKVGQSLPEPDFTAQVLPAASLSDLDPVEVLRLRRILEERGSALAALPDLELLFALGLLERVEGEVRPTVAGLLLAGTSLALRRLLPQAEVSYYFHETEEGYSFREDLLRPIPALLERLKELIQARNRVRFLTVGLFRLEVWDFDQEVYREALVNALVHRDWRSKDAIQVHHYRDRLEVFSRYLQQLVMESLGKKLDRAGEVVHQGLAVYGNKGSTDQHAYVQQLRDGVDNYFVTFIEVLEDPGDIPPLEGENPGDFLDGFLQGTRSALTDEGRFNLSITMQKLDARSLGALIALFERAVGYYGELVNINAYHQPGVEAGKKAAAALLDLQARLEQAMGHKREHTLAELQELMGLPSPEPLYWILRHLCANRRHIDARGDWGKPESLVFTHD